MALNACSINGFTLHGKFCRDKFAALVPILHPPIPPVSTGSNPRVLRDTFKYERPFEIEDRPDLTFEQPIVSVSAEIFGSFGTDTQDVTAVQVDFVSVSDLVVTDDAPIGINIADFRIE